MSGERTMPRHAVAIVGMSGRLPGAPTIRQFWQNLRNGVESLETFTDAELDAAGVPAAVRALPGWVPRGTVLEDADHFDAAFFGYAPREAQLIDPQQRVFLECAWEALEDGGYAGEPDGRTVAIYAGCSLNSYVVSQLLPNRELLASVGGYQVMLGNDKDFLTTRASYKLDLHGPSMAIQTACSTSLVAVQTACQSLFRGECDMALAGGVSISFPQRTGYQYQEGMIFSPDGTCRPFDADARGTRAGAGAGVVLLKRLDDAIADRDTIHAVILGAAINNDGAGKAGYTAPSVDGQVEVIATAQALAGVSPETISYIEAHGTATPLGDPIEVAALTRVFRDATAERGFCTIGSLKANIGHLDAAAGVAGLIKTVLALRHRELPPQLNFRAPNPQLALDSSPFRVATTLEAWERGATPRRAGVSSFGIGGTNAHVVLEEAPAPAASRTGRTHQLLVLSAKTAEALEAATANLVDHLGRADTAPLEDVAFTLQVGRKAFAHRRSVVARDAAEARALLGAPAGAPVVTGVHDGSPRPVAFLFSGQGSQHAGMCRELYTTERVFRDAVDRCAELLHPHFGRDIRELLKHGSDSELSETSVAQPVLFVTEYALAVLWMSWGLEPAAMLGHSIGEYVAAHLAGVFSLEDALLLVAARGHLMQRMAPGEMLAVRLPAKDIRARLGEGATIAAINAPALCTVSGTREAIEALTVALERDGIEHRPLHTSHAFHSAMMDPALAPFREIVARVPLSPPRRRYVSNVTGTWIRAEEATSPDYWVAHLRGTVLFADGVATLATDPTMQMLEVGPGNALTSLARLTLGRAGATRVSASLPHPREVRGEMEAMLGAAGRLWVSGVAIDWSGVHADETLHRVSLPTYPFERTRHWVEAPAAVTPAASASQAPSIPPRERLEDWFFAPAWSRVPALRATGTPTDGAWIVVGDEGGLMETVRARFAAQGGTVVAAVAGDAYVERADGTFVVRPAEAADYDAMLRSLRRSSTRVVGVIHLRHTGGHSDPGSAVEVLHDMMALGTAIATVAVDDRLRVIIATSGAQRVHDEPILFPERALATGPVLVLPVEVDGVQARLVDVAMAAGSVSDPEQAARQILYETAVDDTEQCVAWRQGQRWVRRYERVRLPAAPRPALPITTRGHYLITGGLGGIGLTLAQWLATSAQARLTLVSRTPLPPRDTWQAWLDAHSPEDQTSERIRAIQAIETAGGAVVTAVADAADEAAMRAALDTGEREFGPLSGVIHAAGVLGTALLATSTPAAAADCVSAKVAGTQVLARLLGDRTLDFVLLCSSISAVAGFAGSAAYGAGNAYLDAFDGSAACPPGWHAVSVGWAGWRDVGFVTRIEGMSAERAALAAADIAPAEGTEAFERVLATGLSQVVVSPYDVESAQLVRRRLAGRRQTGDAATGGRPAAAVPSAVTARPPRASSSDGEPTGEIEERLAGVWMDLLGVSPLGAHDNFFELGGHSLMATRVLARIDSFFGVRLPLRAMFEAPTIRQLGVLIAEQQSAAGGDAIAAPSGDREEFEL